MTELSENQIEVLDTPTLIRAVRVARRSLKNWDNKSKVVGFMHPKMTKCAIYLEGSLEMLALEEAIAAKIGKEMKTKPGECGA